MIRAGCAADLPAIMPVMHAAFDPRFGEAWSEAQCLGVMAMPGSHLLIAEQGDPLGFALSRIIVDECELMLIAVMPELQGQGVGRNLLNQVFIDARNRAAANVFLEMRNGNPARALYLSAGFAEVGRRRGYYRGSEGQIHDAITYRCTLT